MAAAHPRDVQHPRAAWTSGSRAAGEGADGDEGEARGADRARPIRVSRAVMAARMVRTVTVLSSTVRRSAGRTSGPGDGGAVRAAPWLAPVGHERSLAPAAAGTTAIRGL